jgi:2-succinyl-6-hydroxy-2,4-cyclohexadiene-1-carboxylate synthase
MMTIDSLSPHCCYNWVPCESAHPNAPTLVFIHGWLLSRRYWEPLIARLQADFSCLSYDLRGFGESHESHESHEFSADYTLQAYAEDLKTLLDDRGIDRAWLVGHSLGGSIALWGAQLMGDRIVGVTCVNAGGGIYLKEEFEKFREAGQQMLKFRPHWLPAVPLLDLVFAQASVCQNLGRDWGRQRLVDFVGADFAAARGSLLESTTEAEVHRLPQVVSGLRQPVHFITGDQDRIMEPRYVRHLASFHPDFQHDDRNVLELKNCGHFAMMEYPERVADALRRAITQSETSPHKPSKSAL